jgi:hypothetical protein
MSKVKAGQFLMMPIWVFLATPEMSYRTVYMILRSFAGIDRSAFPSRQRLATRAGVSCSVVDRALRHFKEIGAIVIEHQYLNNKQRPSVYVFKDDCPAKFEHLDFADRYPVTGDEVSRYLVSTDNDTLSPQTNRTISIELEPLKEKEKILKEKETTTKIDQITEFVNQVKAIYPKRDGNMGWMYFAQRAASHFKSAKSKSDFLLAVSAYKKECVDTGRLPQHVMMPSSFIVKHYDFIYQETESPTPKRVLTIDDVNTAWD